MSTYSEIASGGGVISGFASPITHKTQSTGSLRVGGCAIVTATYEVLHTYEIGDTVYSRPKALKGILRKYTIKKLRTHLTAPTPPGSDVCRLCTFPPLYIDTYNAYHNEEDLVTLAEATALIEAYNISHAIDVENNALNC